jgi:hypothetical protein
MNRLAMFFFSLCITLILPLRVEGRPSGAVVIDTLSWVQLAAGVKYAIADSAVGEDVFIGIGGMTVTQDLVDTWVASLYAAKLRELGIRHLYSVKGPKDGGYGSREIGTLALARHLLLLIESHPRSNRVIVAGHSSGAYVAHALFQDLYDGASIDTSHRTDGKILYFLLDERIGVEPNDVHLTDASADRLGHIYGVYASFPSRNLYSYAPTEMVDLGNRYGSRSSSLNIDASGSGCTAWPCMHMTMINQKPYLPYSWDSRDYGAINPEHPVQTAYLDVITALNYSPPQPTKFRLWQNYPNPFNSSTIIKFELPKSSQVRLTVYDVLGRHVTVLVNERMVVGVHDVKLDASELASGVYFYRLQVGEFTQTKRLMLMK